MREVARFCNEEVQASGRVSDAERLELLAHCVSLTATAVRAPGRSNGEAEAHAVILTHETGLDMKASVASPEDRAEQNHRRYDATASHTL